MISLTKSELDKRRATFCTLMNRNHPDWETAIILSKVNQYYFTGTMQDGVLIVRKDQTAYYFVRRSFERAKAEALFDHILPMESYRDVALNMGSECGNTYLETEVMTLAILQRIQKHLTMRKINSLDKEILLARAIKSSYELKCLEISGKQHHHILQNTVPTLLREGMTEVDFVAELFEEMIKQGHHGISRFSMFQTEIVVGQIGFGESSLYPTSFDGPGGAYGMSPAVPFVGSRERKLKKGDLVFVDIGFGHQGYHSDKTQVYIFGGKPTSEMIIPHRACMEIEKQLAEMLKPGAIPSMIYNTVMNNLTDQFKFDFMGFGRRQAKFLGHGVGLHVDELPVIANGCDLSLVENMVIALEPKKGIAHVGMVGVEDTYIVTADGGRCITGGGSDIIVI